MISTALTITTLVPARVAVAWSFGERPEEAAWAKLQGWAEPRGLLGQSAGRIFGFNHPSPSAGSPNYGYEYQLEVADDVAPSGDIRIGERPGGRYAVLPFSIQGEDPYTAIPAAWQRLDALVAEAGYRQGAHQWLEEHSPEGKLIALYYPIAG
jgi:DNA gyrase inhibitor GyrI